MYPEEMAAQAAAAQAAAAQAVAVQAMSPAQQALTVVGVIASKDLQGMEDATCYAFSRDGMFLAVGNAKGVLSVWDNSSDQHAQPPVTIQVAHSRLTSCVWRADAKALLITDADSNVWHYQRESQYPPVVIVKKAYDSPITASALSKDSPYRFIIGSQKGAKIWTIDPPGFFYEQSFRLELTLPLSYQVNCSAFHPGGSFIAVTTLSSSERLKIFSTVQRKWITFTSPLFPTESVDKSLDTILLSCAWSPNGQFLAGCTRSGIIYIWEFIRSNDPQVAFVKAMRLPENLPIVACVWTSPKTISLVAHREQEGVAKVISILI